MYEKYFVGTKSLHSGLIFLSLLLVSFKFPNWPERYWPNQNFSFPVQLPRQKDKKAEIKCVVP